MSLGTIVFILIILLVGMNIGMMLVMCSIHKEIYGSWILNRKNLPLGKKLKQKLKKEM